MWFGFKNLNLFIEINGSSGISEMVSKTELKLSLWQHVAFVFSDSIGYFYINGFEDISASLSQPAKLKRELNYIGQDFYNSSEYLAVATFDGIKIFNGALRPAEVLSDYTADGIKISYLLK